VQHYVLYDPVSGEILQAGSVRPETLGSLPPEREDALLLNTDGLLDDRAWIVVDGAPAPRVETPEALRLRLRGAAKAMRRTREAAGAEAELDGGAPARVDTARDDVAALTAALVQARAGRLPYPLRWKGGGRFFDVSGPADLEALADAALAQVRSAYAAEAAAVEAIEAGTVATPEELGAAFEAAFEAALGRP